MTPQDSIMPSRQLKDWQLRSVKSCVGGPVMSGGLVRLNVIASACMNLWNMCAWHIRYFSIDKCDQNKTTIPCIHDMLLILAFGMCCFTFASKSTFPKRCVVRLSTPMFKQGERFVVGVVGVQVAGPKRDQVAPSADVNWFSIGLLLNVIDKIWSRWGRVLPHDDIGKRHAWRKLPGNNAHKATSPVSDEGRSDAGLPIHRRRQYGQRDQKFHGGHMGNLHPHFPSNNRSIGNRISIPPCGAYTWVVGPLLFPVDRIFERPIISDPQWYGSCGERRIERFQHELDAPRLLFWLELGQENFWDGVPPISQCTCSTPGNGWQRPLDQVEAVCFRHVMVLTYFAGTGWPISIAWASESAFHPPCIRWEGPSKIFQFFGQIGNLAAKSLQQPDPKRTVRCSKTCLELSAQESSLAASGERPTAQLAELRSYVTGNGLDPGPSLETWHAE